MSNDRIEVGSYEMFEGHDSMPVRLLVVAVNGRSRIVMRALGYGDREFWEATKFALGDDAEAKTMWRFAGGGQR